MHTAILKEVRPSEADRDDGSDETTPPELIADALRAHTAY